MFPSGFSKFKAARESDKRTKEQMVKRTDGREVPSGQGCEGVTVGTLRAVAACGPRTVTNLVNNLVRNLVPAGSNCFLGVPCALLSRSLQICKASRIPSVQQPERTSASSAG
eukprot:3062101-Prymnesium_polylepis.1